MAPLQFIVDQINFPVPRVVCFGLTAQNAIGSECMARTRLPGCTLHSMEKNLNLEQVECILLQCMDAKRQLQAITRTSAAIVIDPTSTSLKSPPLHKFAIPYGYRYRYHQYYELPITAPASPHTCLEWMIETPQSPHEMNFIDDTEIFHFCHLYFMLRNLLAAITSPNTAALPVILDGDTQYAAFCPRFVAYQTLFWMSDDDNEEYEMVASKKPVDTLNMGLKKVFHAPAGEEWLKYAYTPDSLESGSDSEEKEEAEEAVTENGRTEKEAVEEGAVEEGVTEEGKGEDG
ncbi:hypothetical protein P154DRAFT_580073 [Amniculicola lignicola CBS 123094]|uniref:Uncharacterized protein n=1 Tax=Amniculicola lignicola CBS 123094 TaxID=1392246 RepID=A0A6A5W5U5_9PLEO|nr:hypothetical protein P154DRAFT_580073 [Amniculicola lignicola CBS 123094]